VFRVDVELTLGKSICLALHNYLVTLPRWNFLPTVQEVLTI
jgi:hypothetical protein